MSILILILALFACGSPRVLAQTSPAASRANAAPENESAELGRAHDEAIAGDFKAALDLYNALLTRNPENYDALQGKAFMLYWEGRYAESQTIFQQLERRNPSDDENGKALVSIARAMDAARWAAMRPREGAPPQAWLGYEISYLADHPRDRQAITRLARAEARLGLYKKSIGNDQLALRLQPSDAAVAAHMGAVLSWNHQFDASIQSYYQALRRDPWNREALQNLAKVYAWSGRFKQALSTDRVLLTIDPNNIQAQLDVARLESRFGNNRAALQILADLLLQQPRNRDALIQRAGIKLYQENLRGALQDYNAVLAANFQDAEASYSAARIYYYLGEPDRAYPLAARTVLEQPRNFDALVLAARIERARRHPKQARLLLRRAARLDPLNPEIREIGLQLQRAHPVIVQTSSTYSRELAFASGGGLPPARIEDLNAYSSSVKTSFSFLPRSRSYVLAAATPSNSPTGPAQINVAPSELLYGQTTRVSQLLTLRGGFGAVRMGPSRTFIAPFSPFPVFVPGIRPVGYIGFSLFPSQRLSVSFSASRAAITYTPASVSFGVTRRRLEAQLTYALDSRTKITATYDHDNFSSPIYVDYYAYFDGRTPLVNDGRDEGQTGSVEFLHNLIRTEQFSLDAGYSGIVFGYEGKRRGVYMGFYNPRFYQRHMVITRVSGRVWGPVSFVFTGDLGIKQGEIHGPFTRAYQIGPGLALRATRRFSISARYIHYNFAQSFGAVRGNAVELTTDWIF